VNNRTRNSARAIVFASNHNTKIRLVKVELEAERLAAKVAELEAKVDTLLTHSSRGHSIAQRWIEVAPDLGALWMTAMTARANGDDIGFTAAASAAFTLIGDAFSHSSDISQHHPNGQGAAKGK
jgi:hypothetical protein